MSETQPLTRYATSGSYKEITSEAGSPRTSGKGEYRRFIHPSIYPGMPTNSKRVVDNRGMHNICL